MAITDLGVLRGWGGQDLVDRDGVKAGSIVDLYIDERTKQPTWALVRTGLLGSRQTLVPLDQATVPLAVMVSGAGSVQVPFESAAILDAPSVAVGEEISEATAMALRRYYGLGDPAAPAEGDHGTSGTESLDAGAAAPAAKTTAAMTSASTEPSGTMIRSEEELRIRLRRRARRVAPGTTCPGSALCGYRLCHHNHPGATRGATSGGGAGRRGEPHRATSAARRWLGDGAA
jgi:PRC-barrel domain